MTIDGDAGIGRATGVDLDVDFSDILENLDMGGMVHFEAHHESGWGLALDYAFMDLSDDRNSPRGAVLNTDVFEGILEAELIKGTGMGSASSLLSPMCGELEQRFRERIRHHGDHVEPQHQFLSVGVLVHD